MNKAKENIKKRFLREKSVTATVVLLLLVALVFGLTYVRCDQIITRRCLERLDEGVHTVMEEVTGKLEQDSRILNSTADMIAAADRLDAKSVREMMASVAPLLDTMNISLLMADETVISLDGSVTDVSQIDSISFAEEAPLGEHVSDRVYSLGKGTPILRHFVPVERDGKTVALLYGITTLPDMPKTLNIDNIYNGTANVYIVDTQNGDFIMDTFHDELGNVNEYSLEHDPGRETRGKTDWTSYTEDILNLGTGYVIFRTARSDGWEYMYYAPAGINGWSIAVSVPEREAFSSLHQIQQVCIVAAMIMAAAVTAYYLLIHRFAKETMDHAVERAVLEEKLHKAEAAEKAKTAFLSNMSHDIRTPMNAIIGFTALAETNLDNKERVQEYLRKIMSSSNHLLSLINDVLDMSRIESGKLNIEEKECKISDIFRDMRNIIQSQMQSKQLNFFMDTVDVVDEDIYCDKLHVNQVLLNLLSNAIKFTPAGGSVSLTVRQLPNAPTGYGSYEIRVKDTGIGMSPEFAEHIFEPFERERNTTDSGIQGGTIQLETEPGKGTEFILHFDFRLQAESGQAEEIQELRGMHALVVDDSFTTCDSVTKMLMQIGMRSEWTLHGKEAVLRARQALEVGDAFHAYIIDWALPDLSGIEVARQVRALSGDDVPIIVLTAYDWSAIEEEAMAAGVTAFCSKPIFLSELRDTLAAAVGRSVRKEEPAAKPAVPAGTRLLLVEDNELNREIAQELLTENGFAVDIAEDGTVAVRKVAEAEPGTYALVLMDVQMPVMNGYEATRAIRALEDKRRAEIPIVAMTANAFEEDRQLALAAGMNDHVSKPINMDRLLEVLHRFLKEA